MLNAKHHEQEAKIIAEAGKVGAVTIATNMAGRGTDIKLGGNKDFVFDGKKENLADIKKMKTRLKVLVVFLSLVLSDTRVEELIIN